LMHVAPITVGFGNWVALRLWGRRLYRDHYQSHDDGASFRHQAPQLQRGCAASACSVSMSTAV